MQNGRRIKLLFLYISKYLGLFRIARHLTREGLRILAYHNFSMGDEVEFRPKLYIRPETFEKRLHVLEKEKFPVIELHQALTLLSEKTLPNSSTVITIDDGWYGTKLYANKILQRKAFPYTIYVASYYSLKETPVFNLVIQYMFWKTQKDRVDFGKIGLPFTEIVHLSDVTKIERAISQIITYGQLYLDNSERCALAKRLGKYLEVSYSEIQSRRIFSLLNAAEIKELSINGVDIQLHSHRHQWPLDRRIALKELFENRAFLESLTGGKQLQHFCYPSGFWKPQQLAYLNEAGIMSAATCEPGFNYAMTQRLSLKRFLDSETISQIEFQAELFGFLELIRKLRKLMTNRLRILGSIKKIYIRARKNLNSVLF